MTTALCDGIDWVGAVDWNVRDFHGYHTGRGTTYNAYLIRDEKTALVDAVKPPFGGKLLDNVASLVDPADIDYIVCNHGEPDHAGAMAQVVAALPQATVVTNKKCRDTLGAYHDTSGWNFEIVGTGDTLSLGRRTLSFLETPMVHWPDSMVTYVPEERLLISQDAFGQHYASSGRFDDEEPLDVVMWEAKTYYANIIMWAGGPIARAMEAASKLDIGMIAPDHGVIWRSHVAEILQAYSDWIVCRAQPKVLVVYDTMWQSTAQMAEAMVEGATVPGVSARLMALSSSNITTLATEVLDAAVIAFGSPTLNGGMMPEASAALTYLAGLRPACKTGLAFGSYGWSKGGAKAVHEALAGMKVEMLQDPLECRYLPTPEVLEQCRQTGAMMAQRAVEVACAAGES